MVCPGPGTVNSRLTAPPHRRWVVLALGSNLGRREEALALARTRLREAGVPWELASAVRETAPVGGPPGQPPYLNQVVAAPLEAVALDPHALLATAHRIERTAGRVPRERWGPRELDVDLLLFGDLVLRDDRLELPHPRLAARRFVLEPLAEILPGLVHPVLGLSVRELLARLAT
jgi:2-amino-4-hydroxy-6-hydroxymethyldihydropteridine diphosphokinase